MINVEYNFTVNAPPEQVFAFISNPENEPQWQKSCVEAKLESPGAVQKGSNVRMVFNFLTRKMEYLVTIIELVPSERFAFQTASGPLFYEGRYSFSPHNGGTQVNFQFGAEPKSFFGIIPVSLIRKAYIKELERSVKKLKELLDTSII